MPPNPGVGVLGGSQGMYFLTIYLGTWNAISPHKPSPLRTFVCKIARNLSTMKYHSNTAEKRNSQYDLALDELEECLSDTGSVEEAYEAKELREATG